MACSSSSPACGGGPARGARGAGPLAPLLRERGEGGRREEPAEPARARRRGLELDRARARLLERDRGGRSEEQHARELPEIGLVADERDAALGRLLGESAQQIGRAHARNPITLITLVF